MKPFVAILAALVLFPSACLAQALADKVPGDAVLYIGWSGTDNLGPGYDQSHLKALLDASQIRQVLNECLPAMVNHLSQGMPNQKEIVETQAIIQTLAKHPTAIYFGGIDPANQQMPVKVAVLCNAGNVADALTQQINDLLTSAGPTPVKINVANAGGLVTISTVAMDLAGGTLADNKDFKAVMGQLVKDPAFAMYIDGAGLTRTIETGITMSGDQDMAKSWPQIRDGIGLAGLKHIASASGFSGKDWTSAAFIDAPAATRTGVLAMLNSPPVSDDTLKLIPASATVASAGVFDLGAFYSGIRKVIDQAAPPPVKTNIDQAIQQANETTEMNIEHDLLDAFGPEWAAYIDPPAVGNGILGFTVVNRARDATSLENSLTKLETLANAQLKNALPTPKLTISVRREKVAGLDLHFMALPLISPVWTIKDGVWYEGLYPQAVVAAANRTGGKTLLDNPAFQEARKRLNAPAKVTQISFVDVPRLTQEAYPDLLALSRIYLGIGDIFGLQSPPMTFPPLEKLAPEMTPSCSVNWTDDAGFHYKSIEPFPGSGVVASSATMGTIGTMYMSEMPLMIGMLVPYLTRARMTANEVAAASNERQIGQAILLYANDHKGVYPPDLGTLIKEEDITPQVFVSPESGVQVPASLASATPDEQAAWVNQHSSYVYLGSGMKEGEDPTTIVLYEKPEIHGNGSNVAFGDGHVEFVNPAQLQQMLAKQTNPRPDGPRGGGL